MINLYKQNTNDFINAINMMYLFQIIDIIGSLLNINLPIVRYLLSSLSIFFLLKSIFYRNFNLNLTSLLNIVKFLFFLWIIVLIIRALPEIVHGNNGYIDFKQLISGKLLILLIPLTLFYKPNLALVKQLINYSYKISVFYLVITIPLMNFYLNGKLNGEGFAALFAAAASIVLLTFGYHTRKVKFTVIITFFIAIVINVILVRRNQIAYFGSIIMFAVLIHGLSSSRYIKSIKSNLIITLFFLIISAILIVVSNYERVEPFLEKSKTGMDSRETVINDFFIDFNEHPVDWFLGRGINGVIKSSTNATSDKGDRPGIENGYLMHILVGGWIYLGLIILISIPAIYLGFFKSNNILCKAFAAIITTYFIDMIGFGLPSASMKFVLIWVGISVCYSKQMRSYSDDYLKSVVGLK